MEVELEIRGKQRVSSELVAIPMKKTKFETDTVNLLERVINKQNLYKAYKRVKRNKGSHGIDGMCVDELLPYLQQNADTLISNLLNGKSKEKIRRITNRNRSMNSNHRLKKLKEIIVGWVNYYKLANMEKRLKKIDGWIRRRLRACIWKTWKKVRTRFRNLAKLGVLRLHH